MIRVFDMEGGITLGNADCKRENFTSHSFLLCKKGVLGVKWGSFQSQLVRPLEALLGAFLRNARFSHLLRGGAGEDSLCVMLRFTLMIALQLGHCPSALAVCNVRVCPQAGQGNFNRYDEEVIILG